MPGGRFKKNLDRLTGCVGCGNEPGEMPDVEHEPPFLLYRVRARNIAIESENRIHDDEVARRYGFAGGLVPGIVVYGYLTRPVVEAVGSRWFETASTEARFLQPCYEGEEVVVRAEPAAADPEVAFSLTAARPDGTVLARGRTSLPSKDAPPPPLDDFPPAPLPRPRPPASTETLRPGAVLGSLEIAPGTEALNRFAAEVGDELAIYRGDDGVVHPAALLGLANEVLAKNVKLGPWIHAESDVTHFSPARLGDSLAVRARVLDRFERKGHDFVVLDVLVIAGANRVVQRVQHTAIYRPRPRDGSAPGGPR
jgi:acyl dehydratase